MKSALYITDYLDYLEHDNKEPQAGDIFVYCPRKLQKYYYGVVVSNEAVHEIMPSERKLHLHFFNYCTEAIEDSPDLSTAPLLFPPILVRHTTKYNITYDFEKSAWLSHYFCIIGNIDLKKLPSVKQAMFVDGNGWLYDANGKAIAFERMDEPDAYTVLGHYYQERAETLEKWLVSSLDLADDESKPMVSLDYYKKQLNEMRSRLKMADLLCSGECVEMQTLYSGKAVIPYLLPVSTEPEWKRYIKQGGSEHYAVIQFQIKQRIGSSGLFFRNLALPEDRIKGNRHAERMFRVFVLMVYEGIQAFVDTQYKENGIAFGGIEICLFQLNLHEADSRLMDFKIVGHMILADYLKRK